MKHIIAAATLIFAFSLNGHAQSVEVEDSGPAVQGTGKEKAGQYFQTRKAAAPAAAPAKAEAGATPHYLAIHIGTFFSDQSYNWGPTDKKSDGGIASGPGKFTGGVTYRMGEWVNSMDLSIRAEFTSYSFEDKAARKLSFSPMISFPDSASNFPLYFGAGVGLGLFMQQVHGRSPVSLDWQVVTGVRFLNVFDKIGFMVEAGLKNHAMLLSDGQYNGVFISVGSVFAF